ncbi:MAG: helix-turn-helix transcriptional regulator [Planctomycetia bacterium]
MTAEQIAEAIKTGGGTVVIIAPNRDPFWVNAAEAAELLGIAERTFAERVNAGQYPRPVQTGGAGTVTRS